MHEIEELISEARRLCQGEYQTPPEEALKPNEKVVGKVPIDVQPLYGLWRLTLDKYETKCKWIKTLDFEARRSLAVEHGQLRGREETLRAMIWAILMSRFPAAADCKNASIRNDWDIIITEGPCCECMEP